MSYRKYTSSIRAIRTDGDLVRAAIRIRDACGRLQDAINDLDDAEHPNAAAFRQDCEENGMPVFADALHIVYKHIDDPSRIKALRELPFHNRA